MNQSLKRICARSLWALWPVIGAVTLPAAAIPFTTDFEQPDYQPGILVSDPDWAFDPNSLSAEITSLDAASGAQSLRLTGPDVFTFAAEDSASAAVRWVDFYLKPVFVDESDLPGSIDTLQSAVSAFVKSGASGQVYVINGDGQGSGLWVAAGTPISLLGAQSENWIRLSYRLDYAAKKWDLFVDGNLARYDLGFLDADFSQLHALALRADVSAATAFDRFSAGAQNPIFTDLDNDGIADAVDPDSSINDRAGDADGDTLANIEEFRLGTNLQLSDTDSDSLSDAMELQWARDPLAADADLFQLSDDGLGGLLWETGFELAEGYIWGALDQQLGWRAYGVDVREDDNAYAVHSEPSEVVAEHFFGTDPAEQVWFSFEARLHAGELPPVASLEAQTAAVFAFSDASTLHVLEALSGTWQPYAVSADPANWNDYAVFLDYQTKRWSLYLNGQLVAADIAFHDPSLLALSRFKAAMHKEAGSTTAAYLDRLKLYAGNDFDADGLGDDWELEYGFSPATGDSNGNRVPDADEDLDGDGNSNGDEYNLGRLPHLADADVDYYVDHSLGDDAAFDGRSAFPGRPLAASGPKASLAAAISAAPSENHILLSAGTYDESVLSLNGKNLTLRLHGPVTIR